MAVQRESPKCAKCGQDIEAIYADQPGFVGDTFQRCFVERQKIREKRKRKNMGTWVKFSDTLPPEGITVETKIDDKHGLRNEALLTRSGRMLFLQDGTYIYYEPTHWKFPLLIPTRQ